MLHVSHGTHSEITNILHGLMKNVMKRPYLKAMYTLSHPKNDRDVTEHAPGCINPRILFEHVTR